jgi:hypothetical protein
MQVGSGVMFFHHGFSYRCDECKWPLYKLEVKCCLIPESLNTNVTDTPSSLL